MGNRCLIAKCPCDKVVKKNSTRTFKNPANIVKVAFFSCARDRNIFCLEVGSGCLRNAFFIQDLGYKIAVLEVEETINKYKEAYRVFKNNQGEVYMKRFPSRKFDVIICTYTIETICPPIARDSFLEEIHAHLKQTGYLLLAVRGTRDVKTVNKKGLKCPPPGDGFLTPLNTFIKPFTFDELKIYLAEHGFKVHKALRGTNGRPKIIELIAKPI